MTTADATLRTCENFGCSNPATCHVWWIDETTEQRCEHHCCRPHFNEIVRMDREGK